MNHTPRLDEEALAELQDVMEDEFGVLIETYLADSRTRISGLKEAADTGDAERLRKAAHSLKGSCINIGTLIRDGEPGWRVPGGTAARGTF